MHIHLDAVGGIAGDMFCGALLDAFPELAAGLHGALAAAGIDRMATVTVQSHRDHTLVGTRFAVEPIGPQPARHGQGHAHHGADAPHGHGEHGHGEHGHGEHGHGEHGHGEHGHGEHGHGEHGHGEHKHLEQGHAHEHRPFSEIRALLRDSDLEDAVKERALDIFSLLASAEARVHGSSVDDVVFHEVGAWDSIADITAAAWLIEASRGSSWSYSPLPLGSGRVETAHGKLPVPAPATALLLEGFELFDDGRPGERITPTGAAILRHLRPSLAPQRKPMRLVASGSGFGEKTFEGLSNILRILVFDSRAQTITADTVIVCSFDVDDQTAEDLAVALTRLRADKEVLDIVEIPLVGKKGRLASEIRALVRPQGLDHVLERCFSETTTLGVRYHTAFRRTLQRELTRVEVDGRELRVKTALRPDGSTSAKVEMDDLAQVAKPRRQRQELRRRAETAAVSGDELEVNDD